LFLFNENSIITDIKNVLQLNVIVIFCKLIDTKMFEEDNSTSIENLSYCQIYQPTNPSCGIFGAIEIVDVIFLSTLTLVGVFGNLLVISSIIYDKKVHFYGNVFIINLAVADVMVGIAFFM